MVVVVDLRPPERQLAESQQALPEDDDMQLTWTESARTHHNTYMQLICLSVYLFVCMFDRGLINFPAATCRRDSGRTYLPASG